MLTLEQYGLARDVLNVLVATRRSTSVLAAYHEQSSKEQNEHDVIVHQCRTWAQTTRNGLAHVKDTLTKDQGCRDALTAQGFDVDALTDEATAMHLAASQLAVDLGDPEYDETGVNIARYAIDGKRAKFNDVGVLEVIEGAEKNPTYPNRQTLRSGILAIVDQFPPIAALRMVG